MLQSERRQEQAFSTLGGRASLGVVWQSRLPFSLLPSFNFEAQQRDGTTIPDSAASASNAVLLEYRFTPRWSFQADFGDARTGSFDLLWSRHS
ncbi:MAG: hypothetical protein FJ125_11545 [Deltaproteobacteria bacterium]|nr:hypothetical protein [Deltaproteobacteria bacterium]